MNLKKTVITAASLLLVAALLAGCGYNPETVMTIDGEDIVAGEYLLFQFSAVNEASSLNTDTAVNGLKVLDAETEGKPTREWVAENTLQQCKEFAYIEQEFDRRELDEESIVNYYVEYMIAQEYSSSKTVLDENGIGYDSFFAAVANEYKRQAVFNDIYLGEGSDKLIPDEDIAAGFKDNYVSFDYFAFPVSDYETGSMLSEEQKAEMKAVAEKLYAFIEAGDEPAAAYAKVYDEINTVITNPTPDKTAEESFLLSESGLLDKNDTSVGFGTGLMEAVSKDELEKWNIYETVDGHMYLYRAHEVLVEGNEYEGYESNIASILKGDEFADFVTESAAALEAVTDQKAVEYYSPDKIKL